MRVSAEATVFFLVRHALCDAVGVSIAGRRGAIPLNDAGRRQADALAERIADAGCHALYSSPLERAVETAESIAARTGLEVVLDEAFTEIDFGQWSGQSLEMLSSEAGWRRFNELRSWAHVPDGEMMITAQARAVAGLASLRDRHAGERVVVVTHADVIRAVLAYVAGTPLDLLTRFDCDPASVNVVSLGDVTARILRVNDSGSLSGL